MKPSRREDVLFYISLLILTTASLWPLWANRLLPMQDYPQHLFQAHVTATYDDPAFNWKDFFLVDLGLRPYMLWYLAMKPLTVLFGVEMAGKVLFSIYVLLIATLAAKARRLTPKGYLPWGALLLFPFAFHQMYYLGFANYIISLPILFLALADIGKLADQRCTAGTIARHGVYLALLYLSHPFTILVYTVLAVTSSVCSWRCSRTQSLWFLASAGAMGGIFAAWYLLKYSPSSAPTASEWVISWWPLAGSLAYYALQFTGMRWTAGPDWLSISLWGFIAMLFVVAWCFSEKDGAAYRRPVAVFLVSLGGFLALPFWMGYYSYFNLRLAPVSYFALSLLLCRVRVPSRSGLAVALAALALLIGSVQTQKAVAREAETVLPVLSRAGKNSLVLPLVFDGASNVIDPLFFYQIHAHEPAYYHLLGGGGANPALFPNAMTAVQYRPGLRLPYPAMPGSFSWSQHGAYYDYVLVRRGPPALYDYLTATCNPVAESGPWRLYQNKTTRKQL